jgi:predicted dehydrogenase
MSAVRIGFVGLGIIAETHLAVLAGMPQADLVFTVDPRTDRPPPRFRDAAVPHFAGLAEAVAAHDVDLLVLATPTPTHADLAVEALTTTGARVLVEKPLVHDLDALGRLEGLTPQVDLGRIAVAHHFAFSPEVRWAAGLIAAHPEWGPVTGITSAFHDPYLLLGEHAFAAYVSSWMDSGINQLSMLTRFVDLTDLTSRHEDEQGAAAWCTAAFTDPRHGATGVARLRTSWHTTASSKESVLVLGEAGTEVWIDHTAMTGFAAQGGAMPAEFGSEDEPPRKIAHYRPLYETLLAGVDDPALSFATAARVTRLLHARPGP